MHHPDREERDAFRDECGVFGIWGNPEAAKLAYLGIHALQHRGQESSGIVASDNGRLLGHRAMGLVADVFSEERAVFVGEVVHRAQYRLFGCRGLRRARLAWTEPPKAERKRDQPQGQPAPEGELMRERASQREAARRPKTEEPKAQGPDAARRTVHQQHDL